MTLYEKIANQINEMIYNGILEPNEKLPSLRKASQMYGVSPATVQQAYSLLEAQGVIYAKERSGFYINPIFSTHQNELDFNVSNNANESEHKLAHELSYQDQSATKFSQQSMDFVEELLKNMPATEQHYGALSEASSAIIAKPIKEQNIAVSEFIFSILETHKDPSNIPFGSAFPNPELFPIEHLGDSMMKSFTVLKGGSHELVSDLAGGSAELVRQIELRYRLNGLKIRREELVITNGAMEALSLSLQAVTNPGDSVAIESPCFYAVLQILERLQLKAVEIPVHFSKGMNVEHLADSLENFDIKAIVLMTKYQNPTGSSLSKADLTAIYDLVVTHQVPIIVDDVYSEIYFEAELPDYLKTLDQEGLVLHCDSFCKSLAPGFRIGWVAAGRYAAKIERLKLMSTISPSIPAQLAISHYLKHRHYDRHLARLRVELQKSQAKMLTAIEEYFPEDIRVKKPAGGYFLWIELPHGVDALELYRRALLAKISIAPGPIFSASQAFRHYIRLNYGMKWNDEYQNAMKQLGELIEELWEESDLFLLN
ncbi:aminotransferase-like domain-containing protein [Ignatzschineria sp. LJL83]